MKYLRLIIFLLILSLIIIFLGRNLNPFSNQMFNFHDETQAGRIQQFAVNLKHGILPRLAPHFSYGLGYPLFNFYAPTAYWITTLIHLVGIPIAPTIKLSFLLCIVLGFVAMFLFLRTRFSFAASLVGAAFYVTATYFAVEIFVRGNLAETWFLVLFPLCLYLLTKNAEKPTKKLFFITTLALFLLFTVHNIFSLLSLALTIVFAFLLKNKRVNIIAIAFALLLGSYFLIPAVLESKLTYASHVAKETKYEDHFLCAWQLWRSTVWGYGASTKGCDDDAMSFQLGKLHFIAVGLAIVLFIMNLLRKKKKETTAIHWYFFLMTSVSLFLTLYASEFIWKIFAPILALFQFPWRFLVTAIIGTAFLSAYLFEFAIGMMENILKIMQAKNVDVRKWRAWLPAIFMSATSTSSMHFRTDAFEPTSLTESGIKRLHLFELLALTIAITTILFNSKFFTHLMMKTEDFNTLYLTDEYLYTTIAYKVPEYVPRTVDYNYWQSLLKAKKPKPASFAIPDPVELEKKTGSVTTKRNEPFVKEAKATGSVHLNIHYFPFWEIKVDDKAFIPTKFDRLGRPLLKLDKPSMISITYKPTLLENAATFLSLITLIALLATTMSPRLWNKLISPR